MWCEMLENNEFLKKLYASVPELKEVLIFRINLHEIIKEITFSCVMPRFVDYPPQEWVDYEYDRAAIEISLFSICKIDVAGGLRDYIGNIDICKDNAGLLVLTITGTLQVVVKAKYGRVNSVLAENTKYTGY